VARRQVVLVVGLAVHVRTVLVFAAPVLGLAGGVDALGHALAGRRARERARGAADEHPDGTGQRADRGTRRGAADAADANADRMRPRCVADRVAVHVTVFGLHGGVLVWWGTPPSQAPRSSRVPAASWRCESPRPARAARAVRMKRSGIARSPPAAFSGAG